MNVHSKPSSATGFSVGFVLFVATLVVIVALFLVGTPDDLFSEANQYQILVPSAAGIKVGSPVSLRGLHVGTVSDVNFEENASRSPGVILKVSIYERYTPQVRVNSVAWIQTEGLLGDAAVQIGLGTLDQPALKPGRRIPYQPRSLIDEIAGEEFSQNTTVLLREIMEMLRALNHGKGTFGQLLTNDDLYENVEEFTHALVVATRQVQGISEEIGDLIGDVRSQRGSLGKFVGDPDLYDEATKVVARMNGLLEKVDDGSFVGRLATDKGLGKNFQELLARLNSGAEKLDRVLTLVDRGEGSLGMLVHDPSIAASLRHVFAGVNDSWALTNVARNAERDGREAYLKYLDNNREERRQILKTRAIAAIDASGTRAPNLEEQSRPTPAAGRDASGQVVPAKPEEF